MNQFRFLFVDDDPDEKIFLDLVMGKFTENIKISFEPNGASALELLQNENGALPQVIILDLNMPVLDGRKTLKALKTDSRLKDIPVIVYSTSNNDNDKNKSLELGAHSYITKASTMQETVDALKMFIDIASNGKK